MSTTSPAFIGSIPALYDRHLGPVVFEPYAIDLAQRVPPGAERVLEIAAGTGRLSRHLLAALPPTGTLIATDLNETMLAEAARNISDARVTWRAADAQTLPWPDGHFDAIGCQFGLMFFADKHLALREMRRVLRRGGRLVLNTWDRLERNPATRVVHELATAAFPDNPPTFFLTPFSMFDADVLRSLAVGAGFTEVHVETVERTGKSPSAADLATGLVRGNPLWNQLAERGVDAPTFERSVAQALAAQFGDHPCRSSLSAQVLTAVA